LEQPQNWLEKTEAQRWIGGNVKYSTKRLYEYSMKLYMTYTNLSPKQMIDEVEIEQEKKLRERKDVVRERLANFYGWATTEKKLNSSSVRTFVNALRGFYSINGFRTDFKGRNALPKPKAKYERQVLTTGQVRELVRLANNLRDRAMLTTAFQSGMDISTMCFELRFSMVKPYIIDAKTQTPFLIETVRHKTQVNFVTFVGRDAMHYMRRYYEWMTGEKHVVFDDQEPFFKTVDGRKFGVTGMQIMAKKLSVQAGFVPKGTGYNVYGFHALRVSFGSILYNQRVEKTKIDFMMGHSLGAQHNAYFKNERESLRKIYADYEPLLSIARRKEEPNQ